MIWGAIPLFVIVLLAIMAVVINFPRIERKPKI